MEQLQRVWLEIQNNDIAFTFSVALAILTAAALIGTITRGGGLFGRFAAVSPSVLTSVGILGTFVGIFYGLLDFDVSDIDASVPRLLEGLKIAFITSILGMFGAIAVRIIQTLVSRTDAPKDVDATDIFNVLSEIHDDEKAANERQESTLQALKTAIAGEGDSSVVTQIQKLRSATTDAQTELKEEIKKGFDSQREEIREFARTVAENSSKALIEALEGVIRDFNTKISEQFGDNFKQLNEAVGALLIWQENYKQQVEVLTQQFQDSLGGIDAARSSLNEISMASAAIPDTMERVADILTALNLQTENLQQHLESFRDLGDRASEAFPVIEENLTNLTDGMTSAVRENVETIRGTLETHADAYAEIKQGFSKLKDEASQSIVVFTDDMEKALAQLQGQLQGLMNEQSEEVRQTIGQMRDGFEKAVADSNDVMGQQIQQLDEQMQQEVQNVVEVMGGHLASLSSKFVEDYGPLTDKLRQVVRMAEAS